MTMFSQYDELELLAFIEDELDPDAERSLRDRLAHDPEIAHVLESMRRDRAVLRSEPEVSVPDDLTERIEQALTRPMLIAAWGEDAPEDTQDHPSVKMRPGEFRRRHNRPARRRRFYRMALAASIGLIAFGTTWLAVNTGLRTFNNWRAQQAMLAQAEQHDAGGLSSDASTSEVERADAGPTVTDHSAPSLAKNLNDEGFGGVAQDEAAHHTRQTQSPQPAGPLAVEFALVLRCQDSGVAEKSLEQLMAQRVMEMAFVQNFSFEEAMQLERQWLAAHRTMSRQRDPLTAGVDGPRLHDSRLRELTSRALQQVRAADRDFEPSRQLAGQRDLAASYGRQLDYSSRGATHTITIRLSQLPVLLEELDRAQLPGVNQFFLEPLPKEDALPRATNWTQSRTAVQNALVELEAFADDPLIDLPIVIE